MIQSWKRAARKTQQFADCGSGRFHASREKTPVRGAYSAFRAETRQ
jgi:hypothetical protein